VCFVEEVCELTMGEEFQSEKQTFNLEEDEDTVEQDFPVSIRCVSQSPSSQFLNSMFKA